MATTSCMRAATALLIGGSMLTAGVSAFGADWSDTSIGYRYGTKFAEPFNNQDIAKNIFNLEHVSGYKYGTNYFNVDLLLSDSKDPANASPNATGAQEAYIVYRNTVSLSKVSGKEMKFGVVRDLGITFGFDWNAKTDAGYNSKKRMPVLGPMLSFDVPGFLNAGVLALWESNAPCNTFTNTCTSRYSYDTHAMFTANWGIPIGDSPFKFQGYVNYITSKGTNEFGGPTSPETNFDGAIMLDVGRVIGGPKDTFKVGLEYQYWKNKFGNPTTGTTNPATGQAGPGATAKTPMIRVEYHF